MPNAVSSVTVVSVTFENWKLEQSQLKTFHFEEVERDGDIRAICRRGADSSIHHHKICNSDAKTPLGDN